MTAAHWCVPLVFIFGWALLTLAIIWIVERVTRRTP